MQPTTLSFVSAPAFERIAAMARAGGPPVDDQDAAFDPVLAVRLARHGERGGMVGTRMGALYGGLSLAAGNWSAGPSAADTVHF